MVWDDLDTPIGTLRIYSSENGIARIDFPNEEHLQCLRGTNSFIADCKEQLRLYFKGRLKEFSVKLDLEGTDFQKSVWRELMKIPYGFYATYGEIARRVGKPNASRAVGNALNKNPIPIIIPCHRVIGSDMTLKGFAGGLNVKSLLLQHEGIAFKK
ncbi:cysteine methyltransferase [Thermoanaerobacterium sp. PSU-2]|uniref:methylated-DNA--[protein]-cysteine S-methyltransferase n=1 Tax=Thermoanaerobacterium sp. PSU-2 TaxID=1930849 RepID=UPI000A1680CE|nr:methylated-DNA--[protein]-cysteine S-methyltransferase [Thermoanaerobacterium sp. PSU-2]ORX23595.1 cysteine methyltransferase [Thermoanaerobacterium sp. PSU-2]HHV73410.1 methylated-DNA--[protein]-cysteine S-methyltransferase [Thermoanaerobacterium sp.]